MYSIREPTVVTEKNEVLTANLVKQVAKIVSDGKLLAKRTQPFQNDPIIKDLGFASHR